MARSLYGASPADYTVDPVTGAPDPGVNFALFDAIDGSPVTSLLEADPPTLTQGDPITTVTSNGSGAFPFWGPDGYTESLWFEGVDGWYGIHPTDLAGLAATTATDTATALAATIDHEARVTALEEAPGGTTPEIEVQDLLYRALAEDGITVPDDFPQYINAARLAAATYNKSEVDTKLSAKVSQLASWTQSGTLTTGTGAQRLYVDFNCTIVAVRASVVTAPTGASLIVDVNKNGTTIFGTQAARPTIVASSVTAAGGAPTVTTITAGQYLTIDVDQIGSTIAGADLTVTVTVRA